METKSTLIIIAVSAIVGSLSTAALLSLSGNANAVATGEPRNDLVSLKAEIAQLKSDLTTESQTRMSLEQQFLAFQNGPNRSADIGSSTIGDPQQQVIDQSAQREQIQRAREQRRAERAARFQPGYRQQQLVSAGFADEEAARIVQIESEESLRQLQAQYDVRREQALASSDSSINSNAIRAELGDENYERYLEANGRPVSAQVGSVIGGSPGERAGLKPGDQITSYAGERVFNLNDVNGLTIRGDIGQSVLIEVQRQGELVQLTIPRGPIGISSRRGGFRR